MSTVPNLPDSALYAGSTQPADATVRTVACPAGQITGSTQGDVATFHSIDFLYFDSEFADAVRLPADTNRRVEARRPRPDAIALTITAPADARSGADLPVLVYIHGGRFESGTHEDPRADGRACARAGIVHVQLGYRVGLAGFARFGGDEPNHYRGIDDCQLGLEWIQTNIESFGGDPTNVTVLGQSAGASITLWLARRDHYRGAFRRVVALSPAFPRQPFEDRKDMLRLLLRSPITRRSLETLNPRRLQRGYRRFRARFAFDVALGPAPFDGAEIADIPVVLSSTRDEFYHEPAGRWADQSVIKRASTRFLARRFGMRPNRLPAWRAAAHELDPHRPVGRLIGDAMIRRWVVQAAEQLLGPVWMLEFVRSSKPALHCDELKFLFGLHADRRAEAAEKIHAWLVRFVHDGETGVQPYRPEHAVLVTDMDTGAQVVERGTLDYVAAAFS